MFKHQIQRALVAEMSIRLGYPSICQISLMGENRAKCDFSGAFPHLVFTTIPPGRAL
jgi:hypothetical protein